LNYNAKKELLQFKDVVEDKVFCDQFYEDNFLNRTVVEKLKELPHHLKRVLIQEQKKKSTIWRPCKMKMTKTLQAKIDGEMAGSN
jgi:hypothetical protein